MMVTFLDYINLLLKKRDLNKDLGKHSKLNYMEFFCIEN